VASSRRQKRKLQSEINVVPYIDVMLVLLIVFMVAAPMLQQGVEVDLPKAPAQIIDQTKDEPLIVSVTKDGSFYLNVGGDPSKAQSLDDIADKTSKILKNKPDTPVLVWGDKQVSYGVVVTVMSALQNAGASGVGLVTENPKD
jgi:biopolymer transport protein TolR